MGDPKQTRIDELCVLISSELDDANVSRWAAELDRLLTEKLAELKASRCATHYKLFATLTTPFRRWTLQ
jgi:hypothetical protein